MTAATGSTHPGSPAGPGRTRHVLLRDARGRLILRRPWPWHRVLARCAAARPDRQRAAGASPDSSASLAARATQPPSMKLRRDPATSVQRILAAAGGPPAVLPSRAAAAPPPRPPPSRAQISQPAGPPARLAGYLAAPGPVPVQAVAMVSQLLADGTGPLYRQADGDDLGDIIDNIARALTR